jgi:hypothetical protein
MSGRLTAAEVTRFELEAGAARRLSNDPDLHGILRDLEAHAVNVAINDPDPRTRESARVSALAVRTLWLEIQNRIDTALNLEHVRQRARAAE